MARHSASGASGKGYRWEQYNNMVASMMAQGAAEARREMRQEATVHEVRMITDSGEIVVRALHVDADLKSKLKPLKPDEAEQLEQSVLSEGVRDALVVWQGHDIVVDGHNRLALCIKHSLPCRVAEKHFNSRADVIVWMVMNQLGRRNWSEAERIKFAHEYLRPALEEQARERQREAGEKYGKGHSKEETNGEQLPPHVAEANEGKPSERETREKVASAAEVGREKYRQAAYVMDHAPSYLCKAYEDGDIAARPAYELTKALEGIKDDELYGAAVQAQVMRVDALRKLIKQAERERKAERIKEASEPDANPNPIAAIEYSDGDIVHMGEHVLVCADNNADMVRELLRGAGQAALAFCDPPYNAAAAEYDTGNFIWSQDWLIDHADIVAVTPGIGNIPGFMRQTAMPYRWSTSTYIKNGMTRSKIGFGNWIYTALFAHGSVYQQDRDVYEVSISSKDHDELSAKRQKPPAYLAWMFELFSSRGDLIIDAFGGSGISVIVANRLGRRCICIEKDVVTFNRMVARIKCELEKAEAV